MKVLGVGNNVCLNGKDMKVVKISKKGVLFSNKLEMSLEDIEIFLLTKELVITDGVL